MKVILVQDIAKTGKKGDLIEVADGYGRNYLLVKGLAFEATAGKIRAHKEEQKAKKVRDDKKRSSAEETKKKIGGKVVTIKANAGDGGKLFGRVTSAQVAEALETQYGVTVDKKGLKFDEQIKLTGTYAFKVKLYPGVEAALSLRVEADQE